MKLELKIPPPIVMLICAGIMWLLHYGYPQNNLEAPIRNIAMLVFIGLACLFAGTALYQCHRQRTTIHPFHPEQCSQLITTGIFRVSRNPMYLALVWALLAFSCYLGSFMYAVVGIVLFTSYLTFFQIVPEERALALKFGQAYQAYLVKVRRWI